MLLAAGLGTRLGPLTADRPKCMIPVAGRAVMLRNLDWLHAQGVDDVVINLHHHGEAVVAAIGDGSALGMRVAYSRERTLMGTAGGVLAARPLLGNDTFVVVFADNLFELDLAAIVEEHRRTGAVASMALFEREDVSSSGVALLDTDGWVVAFQEKPLPGDERSHWVNAGLLICDPSLYDAIPHGGPSDLSRDVMPVLAGRTHGLRGYRIGLGEQVMWIDTIKDLRRTEALVANRLNGDQE